MSKPLKVIALIGPEREMDSVLESLQPRAAEAGIAQMSYLTTSPQALSADEVATGPEADASERPQGPPAPRAWRG